jgi:hypothetical protein
MEITPRTLLRRVANTCFGSAYNLFLFIYTATWGGNPRSLRENSKYYQYYQYIPSKSQAQNPKQQITNKHQLPITKFPNRSSRISRFRS